MICTQIEETASQLNSCDAFVLTDYNNHKVYVWCGKEASEAESQAGFNNAAVLANTGEFFWGGLCSDGYTGANMAG